MSYVYAEDPDISIGEVESVINSASSHLFVPKKVATVKLCKGIIFNIDSTMEFTMPNEAQRKALRETFCIEVIPAEETSDEI